MSYFTLLLPQQQDFSAAVRCGAVGMLLCLFVSCALNEPTPPKPAGDWQVLVVTDEANSRYVEYAVLQADAVKNRNLTTIPARLLNNNLFRAKDSIRGINGRVSKIYTFRNNLYVFLPEQRRIEVLSAATYRSIATLDFASQNRTPVDIIFANATTGYIAFSNASVLGVLDVTNFTIPMEIPVGRNPVALAVRENQIYCALRGDNQVVRIDSRTNTVTERISVPPAPQYLHITPSGVDLIVVSAGAGRFDNLPRTAPRVSRLNLPSWRITQQAPIVTTSDSTNDNAFGLVVTEQDFIYVPTNRALHQIDVQNLFFNQATLDGAFRSITYNPVRDEVLIAETDTVSMNSTCLIINPKSGRDSIAIPLTDLRARARLVFTR
ncbi:MAG: hypothetical protein RML40_11895 [Bacteroidota bacterium]|nr:hypothetical protein [Candidatus Kapabacteria bacterium]MDW8221217.1 hypothetical protein [Bacteroidota bacterium]